MFACVASPVEAEELLFTQLEQAQKSREAQQRESRIGPPVRVIVPSRSLRDHLSRAWLLRRGGAQLGVAVQTHHAAALEVLERCGCPEPRGDRLVPIWVERFASREPSLRDALAGFSEGFATVNASVRDLLDAGYRPHHEDAATDALAGMGSRAQRARARAILRVAARVRGALEAAGLADRSALFERAEAALRDEVDASRALPTFALFVYGFADATGVGADWLAGLMRRLPAQLIVELPRDPAEPARRESRYAEFFLERLAERVGSSPPESEADTSPAPQPPRLLEAPGAVPELRTIAVRIRSALDRGVPAEEIGVVARNFDSYRPLLGAEFRRLGIPASSHQIPGYSEASGRRGRALRSLLEDRGDSAIDAWLAADRRADADLALALHRIGVSRLGAWADLDLSEVTDGERPFSLPVRLDSARSLSLGVPALRAAQRRAQRLRDHLEQWPERASLAAHRECWARVLTALGLAGGDSGSDVDWKVADGWQEELPQDLELSREEWQRLFFATLTEDLSGELLGAGGGVQVLSVTAARSRCFRELFVIGLNRDCFPRSISEDPLFPDALRRALRAVLPDLPVKGRGRHEERHLFASLCGAAPHCTLTWTTLSEEGRELAVSPLVTRLQARGAGTEHAPALRNGDAGVEGSEPDALGYVLRAALGGAREELTALWPPALQERAREVSELLGRKGPRKERPERVPALAAVLEILDASPAGQTLGPFFGLVEATSPSDAEDTERPELFITQLDQLLRCPWQRFLRRELRLEPVPDCAAELPAPNPRLRGSVVHRALHRIVVEQGVDPADLAGALERGPRPVAWPAPAKLDAIILSCAEEVAREAGWAGPEAAHAVRLLADSVTSDLATARALDWGGDAAAAVYGAELNASLRVRDRAGRLRRIGLRADRVDRRDGELCFIEYKTGRGFATGVAERTRLRKLATACHDGEGLQPPAYVRAATELGEARSRAELAFLRPGIEPSQRVTTVRPEHSELFRAFERAAATALEAIDAGVRIPRLIDGDPGREPDRCASCEVALACLRGESRHRATLAAWRDRSRPKTRAERAAAALLRGATPSTSKQRETTR